jgi:hypothetical protein
MYEKYNVLKAFLDKIALTACIVEQAVFDLEIN